MTDTNRNPTTLTDLNLRALFLVWGTPDQGPRSRIMADKLGIPVHYIATSLPRGALYIPIKYPLQGLKTLGLFWREKPQIIFVQNPPLLTVIFAWLYSALTGGGFIIDAHSEAMLTVGWTAPRPWIKRLLSRRAITTIVTNEHLANMVTDMEGHATIIRDIPTEFVTESQVAQTGQFNVALINTFAADEPLDEVLTAAAKLPAVNFYITGRVNQRRQEIVDRAPANVTFTGFLADPHYYALLNEADAVMCLTTRNHTMQRGACEALSLGKPIITSDWPILRTYFNKGTVHVDNSVAGIEAGVQAMQADFAAYQAGIAALQIDQRREWAEKVTQLKKLIQKSRH